MTRRAGTIPLSLIAGAILLAACVDIPTGSNDVLSFQFAPLPSNAVVLGDTLRDSLGIAAPVKVLAFNYQGDTIVSPDVRFSVIDRGIVVDSLTGIVVGDSVRQVARVFARLGGFNGSVALAVAFRPDSIAGSNDRDSLSYSLTDTATNVSAPMGVRVLNQGVAADTSVASWQVSFVITSPSDTLLARLVGDNGTRSSIDTTDASGVGARRIRIDVTRLTAVVDSVIVQASVKYRGVNVRGSPARLVLKVKPK